ncbi:LOW QUALITY PROTEIN: centrosomal protein of 152 kDa-like [Sinocyclocheilus rhinocerous]|uniref:LOW QUALITY PROTEIN: centrosomal protein of 152 kDa-like n=1 Tax=Sinocyclocheilus rhinocerous TaxID=307959 RepID=UPI0007B97D66|nr:PREDICTED: LOW QUALITY PROTEIN: centrosomal protein of 152 kDa-like [Sinocyclocheilus rhinocerous]
MSIDFDSAALQTQQEEEEYDQEDYAREQELHKLLTDLPDDMLDDSADCSSPELNCSTCSRPEDNNRPQHAWNVPQWEHPRPSSHEEHYEEYYQGSYHEDYSYKSHMSQTNSHPHHLQTGTEHLATGWDQQNGQNYQYQNGDYAHSSAGTDESHGTDFSPGDGAEQDVHPNNALQRGAGYHGDEAQAHGEHDNIRHHFQVFDSGGAGNKPTDHYKASYHPHQPSNQPKMFNPQVTNQNGHFDQIQRDFLDSTQNPADGQQLAQLQILNRAQSRQIEELEQKLEDCRRRMRYLEHQFAIVKERKCVRTQSLKQQHVAGAVMDSMKQQMMDLCRSDTLTRAREQHDRDMAAIQEQYEAKLLTLQQKLDTQSQSLNEQAEAGQQLLDQVRLLERQREEDQVDRAAVINTLTQRLEESQQQCAKLLHTGSVQEMSQLQLKLQQAQSARAISEDISKALQEELTDLKEQINLYESAINHGALGSNGDWENQPSESYMDLGIKKSKWRNGRMHSKPHIAEAGDSNLLKEDVVRELKSELQCCLSHLKTKRLKISELQEELRRSQTGAEQLQTQLEQAERTIWDSKVRESSLEKCMETSHMTAAPHKDLIRLQEERQVLQERVEALEKSNQELKQSEEKVKAANSELCTKMREMIQELDQEKQEAAERDERTPQQFRDDVVNRVREQLTQEHTAHIEQLSSQHQQHLQQLQSKLADLSHEVLAVQECYISVCKEKDKLEENLQNKLEEQRRLKENELKRREESEAALERLRSDLERQHQEDVSRLKAQCETDTQAEIEQLETARKSWQQEQETLEQSWAQRLQEAEEEVRKARQSDTREGACQLEVRLSAQKETLQQEAVTAQARAVEEAVRDAQREMQQKHTDDITLQVEGAISRARSRWLQDLTSLSEYKSSLQREKDEWERLQQQHVQEQVSSAVKAVEERWQDTLRTKCAELEQCNVRNRELQEEALTLSIRLERLCQEQAALVKAELAAALDVWIRDKQEEMSRLRGQLQREQNLEQTDKQRDTELHENLREKEQEWRDQQEIRLQEEMLGDLKEVLQERVESRRSGEEQTLSSAPGTIRSRVWEICRESLSQAVNQAKQEWKKSSEDQRRHVLKETQERHEAEMAGLTAQRKQSECAESVAKLQKKNQEPQRHLEKVCRQLQTTVREHKNTLQKMKDEHEAVLQKEQRGHLRALEELKQTSNAEALSSGSVSQQNLQAGLEEIKEQYMKAVEKIRGDMLRYLQESKERAAELIRTEVLRERQDTARRMRRYYLTCLQELLEDGGQAAGAEKKINAASKLAAMAKVLEIPVAKRKLSRTQNSQGGPDKTDIETSGSPAKVLGAEALKDDKNQRIHQIYNLKDTNYTSKMAKQKGVRSKAIEPDSLKSAVVCGSKGTFTVAQVTQKHTHFAHDSVFNSDVRTPNVTLRKHSREMFTEGFGEPSSVQSFLIEEAPVRDDGQSDWSLTSNRSNFINNIHLTSSYPEPGKPFSVNGGLDFGSSIGDSSDVTIHKEIVKPHSYAKPNVCVDWRTDKHREPIPGSEGHGVRKMCPKNLFSELKVCQQDSGFDSLLALLQK